MSLSPAPGGRVLPPRELLFVLGGARSGKSHFAEELGARGSRVLFVATAEAHDDDMRARIARHRAERSPAWDTLEEPLDLPAVIGAAAGPYDTVVLDCLTLWVSNMLLRHEHDASLDALVQTRTDALLDVYERGAARWIVVSNEVGLGVVPPTPLGRIYRDLLGRVNQRVAQRADRVFWMVAGIPVDVKALGAPGAVP